MARVIEFCDGAERGDASWWTTGGTATTTNAVHGTYCYQVAGNTSSSKTLTTGMSEFYFRAWIRFPSGVGTSYSIFFRNSTTELLRLTFNQTLMRIDVSTATTGNTGNNSITPDTWQCLEVHYLIHDTTGEVTIRLDGTQVFTFTGDTKPGAATTVDNFYHISENSSTPTVYIDDFALDDSTWCGLGYYVGLTANGAGDVTQFTPTGGANYANVSIPASDSTYNTGTTGNLDNYAMTSTTIGAGTVLRVIPWARVKNAAGGTVNVGLKTNGTDYITAVTTPTSFTWEPGSEYTNNPQSGDSWTQAELDALQFTVSVP